jgi:hypothetical protein
VGFKEIKEAKDVKEVEDKGEPVHWTVDDFSVPLLP